MVNLRRKRPLSAVFLILVCFTVQSMDEDLVKVKKRYVHKDIVTFFSCLQSLPLDIKRYIFLLALEEAIENSFGIDKEFNFVCSCLGRVAFCPMGEDFLVGTCLNFSFLYKGNVAQDMVSPVFGRSSDFLELISYSPDGEKILTRSWDEEVLLWDVQTNTKLFELGNYTDRVSSAEFSSDGKRIFLGSDYGMIRVCSAQSGKELLWNYDSNLRKIFWVMFHPNDENSIFIGAKGCDENYYVGIWSSFSLSTFLVGDSEVVVVAPSPDGTRFFVVQRDGIARLYTIRNQKVYRSWSLKRKRSKVFTCAVFSFDGKKILTGSADGKLCFWDVERGMHHSVIAVNQGRIVSLAISLDGKKILVNSNEIILRLFRGLDESVIRWILEEAHPLQIWLISRIFEVKITSEIFIIEDKSFEYDLFMTIPPFVRESPIMGYSV